MALSLDRSTRNTSITCGVSDDRTRILSAITKVKEQLAYIIEPDFGLLNELCKVSVLSMRQLATVRTCNTVYERNDAILNLLTEDKCVRFLEALRQTDQQHIVNFIIQKGGKKRQNDFWLLNLEAQHTLSASLSVCLSVHHSLHGSAELLLGSFKKV